MFLKSAGASVALCLGLGSAAMAVPVTFTYTSNPVDLSDLEAWKYDYLGTYAHYWQTLLPGRHAEVSVEVDCDITSSQINCAQVSTPSLFLTLTETRSPRSALSAPPPIKLVGVSGFTEGEMRVNRFRVDTGGNVVSWNFMGSEYAMVGDFQLSDSGDHWEYSGSGGSAKIWCDLAFGARYDSSTGLCQNGETPPNPALDLRLGTGVWTARLADGSALPDVPVPASLPLVLGGVGALVLLRRRKTRRSTAPEGRVNAV